MGPRARKRVKGTAGAVGPSEAPHRDWSRRFELALARLLLDSAGPRVKAFRDLHGLPLDDDLLADGRTRRGSVASFAKQRREFVVVVRLVARNRGWTEAEASDLLYAGVLPPAYRAAFARQELQLSRKGLGSAHLQSFVVHQEAASWRQTAETLGYRGTPQNLARDFSTRTRPSLMAVIVAVDSETTARRHSDALAAELLAAELEHHWESLSSRPVTDAAARMWRAINAGLPLKPR